MLQRNKNFTYLSAGYLFPEIARRRREFSSSHPDKKIISLGIGNTTEPLTPYIAKAMSDYSISLGTKQGYSGYGDEQGLTALREKIANVIYDNKIKPDEVFISDGAKCDIARIQTLFGSDCSVAVQDPAYPVYVDGSVIAGAAQGLNDNGIGHKGITYMPCTPKNKFFPDLSVVKPNSLIYFCSPNNPTGAVSTREELQKLVEFSLAKGCIIIFDAAYSAFIRDSKYPKSIYEIKNSEKCAIEINSFSKPAGFTGVRLGWAVVPESLKFADGSSVRSDWNRVMTTLFNGASNIAQHGGLAALNKEGLDEMYKTVDYYLENAKLISKTLLSENFSDANIEIYSTGNSPYVWVKFPKLKSWDVFDKILNQCCVVTTPGSGFGPYGENFLRFSAFGHREDIEEACERLKILKLK